jgi:hypothetical protein
MNVGVELSTIYGREFSAQGADCVRLEIYKRLRTRRPVLIKKAWDGTPERFVELSAVLLNSLSDYSGGDAPRRKFVEGVYSSSDIPGGRAISPHNEKSYSTGFPELIIFGCSLPSEYGGDTVLVDGHALLNSLSERTLSPYRNKLVKYTREFNLGESDAKTWQQTYETNSVAVVEAKLNALGAEYCWLPGGGLRVAEVLPAVIKHRSSGVDVFFSPSHRWHESHFVGSSNVGPGKPIRHHSCCFADGTPLDVACLDEIRRQTASLACSVKLQQTDILILDNVLTLHGRLAFEGDRLLLTAMGNYVECKAI